MFKILVIEDNQDLNQLFCRTLQKNNYIPFAALSAEEALKIMDDEIIDLIITDVMLPGMDGFELVRELRSSNIKIPIMVITARGDIMDKEIGFHSGADDYMVKPVNIYEMILRVETLLRRASSVNDHILTFGDTRLTYDFWTMEDNQGKQILPQKEFMLLFKLLSYPGQIFTRQQLLDDVWGGECEDSHTLDVHISRIREKIRNNNDFEIVTIRGLGYRAVKK